MKEKLEAFGRLLGIMDDLREKCPWDRKQTMQSLRNLTIEETYELADAILDENMEEVKEELGDLMLHIVFYAKIAEEKKSFTLTESIHAISMARYMYKQEFLLHSLLLFFLVALESFQLMTFHDLSYLTNYNNHLFHYQ